MRSFEHWTAVLIGLCWAGLSSAGCDNASNNASDNQAETSNAGSGATSTATYHTGGSGSTSSSTGGGATSTNSTVSSVGGSGTVAPTDKIDVLLMIDNTMGMKAKQLVMAQAVPYLLRRLANPDCVASGSSANRTTMADPNAACPSGLSREFKPVSDIHIGVVTSSLGDYGGDVCPETGVINQSQNDHAWLLGAVPRSGGSLPAFLSYTPTDASDFEANIGAKADQFKQYVNLASEIGCGNEASLEAWYRFLVDPEPPTDVTTVSGGGVNQRGPVDNVLLEQRKAFLRPDSLVAVIMLTDENDCSMRDDSYAWMLETAGSGFRMWRGSSVCATNPNDRCCFSCAMAKTAPADCQALDPSCNQTDAAAKLTVAADSVNMRCRQQKRRLGYDFLFPWSRYVNALTLPTLCPKQTYGDLDCDCKVAKARGVTCTPGASVPNPLFQNLDSAKPASASQRVSAEQVFFVPIVGVPWQDLATSSSLSAGSTLVNRAGTEVQWDLFAPPLNSDESTFVPGDPLMLESTLPRTGKHPITGEAIAVPSAGRLANSINGHEYNTNDADPQYACIFSLEQPLEVGKSNAVRVCDLVSECGASDGSEAYQLCARQFDSCNCTLSQGTSKSPYDPTVSLNPLCQTPTGGYGSTQYFVKAYPGLRHLAVARGLFEQASSNNVAVGSICPKDLNLEHRLASGYGYNPVMEALVQQMAGHLR